MIRQGYPQPILIRLSDVSDTGTSTAHRTAYVTTTLAAIVHALRNLECQPDPFNEFLGPDALFSRLLAGLAGSAEYDAVMGNEAERLNALLAEQVLANETLRRERDEARAELEALRKSEQGVAPNGYRMLPLGSMLQKDDLVRLANDPNDTWDPTECAGSEYTDPTVIYCRKVTTPTPGAQA